MGWLDESSRKELSRKRITIRDGLYGDLVAYDIEGYGYAETVENMSVESGEYRRSRSLIPKKYAGVRGYQFDWGLYKTDVTKEKNLTNSFTVMYQYFAESGKGLYIYSSTKGSGKTMLACCLGNEIVERYNTSLKFVTVLDLLEMAKRGYNGQESKKRMDELYFSGILIIDDLGTEMKKDWIDSVLFHLVDYRYTNRKVTIFTSNIEIDSLKLDERIINRINEMCIPLHIPEKSIRSMNMESERRKFLSDIYAAGQKEIPPQTGG
ncbi:MAG: ATP-binding protein [Lachnospiraceae bacterium]|nr:ATP-binding protein [Lachnospiraceae bacterium]MDE6251774.1 ATP-binding protein [Lachnospiraceae bacterium]